MRFLPRLHLRVFLVVVTPPRLTLGLAGFCLAVCIFLGVFRLPIATDQNRLFSSDVPFFRDYLEFSHKFPENEAVYIIIEPADPSRPPPLERWTAAADAIAGRMRGLPQVVKRVHHKVPVEQLGDQGLIFEDPAVVPKKFAEVQRFLPMVRTWAQPPGTVRARAFGDAPMARFLGELN